VVCDLLTNAHLYAALGTRIARGLRYLAETDLASLAPGKHEIDGKRLFALVSDYTPKPSAACRWEAHRHYIDLQYMVSGLERMGVAAAAHMKETGYEADRDLAWLEGTGDFLGFGAGQFMLLWPGDAHMPGIDAGVPGLARKVVVKIALEVLPSPVKRLAAGPLAP
jgi:biofilm protein TabA